MRERKRELWRRLLRDSPTVGDLLDFTRLAEAEAEASSELMRQWRTAVLSIARSRLCGEATQLVDFNNLVAHMAVPKADRNNKSRQDKLAFYRPRAMRASEAFTRFREHPLLELRLLSAERTALSVRQSSTNSGAMNHSEMAEHARVLLRTAERLLDLLAGFWTAGMLRSTSAATRRYDAQESIQ